ncbi:hypothetical protein [Streptomyces sp. NPDC088789]|uniref:hypothetical protein n=1 Tax=Streptomyces sp. NPDC088789 TaxID=3365899 RepID=UPI0037FC49C3
MFAMAALLLLGAQWLQLVEGHSPLEAGVRLLPLAAGSVVTSVAAPVLGSRIGARAVLSGGPALSGAGFVLLYVAPSPLEYGWAATALALQGAGAGSLAIASALIMSGSPRTRPAASPPSSTSQPPPGVAHGRTSPDARTETAVDATEESLGGALEVAHRAGLPELAAQAQDAFTESFARVGLIGCIILFAAAAPVYVLTPRDVDVREQHH